MVNVSGLNSIYFQHGKCKVHKSITDDSTSPMHARLGIAGTRALSGIKLPTEVAEIFSEVILMLF